MKKLIPLIMLLVLSAVAVRADVVWQEQFNYADGSITNTSAQVWTRFSGSASPSDALVKGHRLENGATSGTLVNRADDIRRQFSATYSNAPTVLYASFVVNCTNLPNAAGTYFTTFYGTNGNFEGKLFALVGTNLTSANTWRLGVSGAANAANKIYPVDLATNTDYQVVLKWDPITDYSISLWVNPVNSSDPLVESTDIVTPVNASSFASRQASSFGNWFATISNLVVATSYDEAATNVWAYNSVNPKIIYQPQSGTVFVGNPLTLSAIASGQGLGSFAYIWQKNGTPVTNPNGNSSVFTITPAALTDAGTYTVIVSNTVNNATVTSASAVVNVQNGPPVITSQPANTTNYLAKSFAITVGTAGTPPLSYSWSFNGGPVTSANIDLTTTNAASLVILNQQSDTTGKFKCFISNAYGSTNSVTTTNLLLIPAVVSIDYLHAQVDSTFFLPTNTTTYYTITNAVVLCLPATNSDGSVKGSLFTGTPNAEFYVSDGTNAICVFDAGYAASQPQQGDIVTVTGPISQFNSLLEFNLNSADASTVLTVTGHTNTIPTPYTLPLTFTNGTSYGTVSNLMHKYVGSLVTFTNVYFPAASVGGNFASGTYTLTNLNGDTFAFFLNAADINIIGKPIPAFASSITGIMGYFATATSTNRGAGFEMDPFDYYSIVSTPPAPKVGVTYTGGAPTLTWTAASGFSYSVLWSTNVMGPYTAITTGLTFPGGTGTYTDSVNTSLPASFYKISSP